MKPRNLSRRELLGRLAAAGAWAMTPARLLRAAESIHFKDDPFTLGVASGYPGPDAIVLWTRLAPAPLEPRGGMPLSIVPV
jgi:alkaline phosphatase D